MLVELEAVYSASIIFARLRLVVCLVAFVMFSQSLSSNDSIVMVACEQSRDLLCVVRN